MRIKALLLSLLCILFVSTQMIHSIEEPLFPISVENIQTFIDNLATQPLVVFDITDLFRLDLISNSYDSNNKSPAEQSRIKSLFMTHLKHRMVTTMIPLLTFVAENEVPVLLICSQEHVAKMVCPFIRRFQLEHNYEVSDKLLYPSIENIVIVPGQQYLEALGTIAKNAAQQIILISKNSLLIERARTIARVHPLFIE